MVFVVNSKNIVLNSYLGFYLCGKVLLIVDKKNIYPPMMDVVEKKEVYFEDFSTFPQNKRR